MPVLFFVGRDDYNFFYFRANASVFVVAFSVVKRDTFERVKEFWLPKCHESNASTPIVLLGLQTDLRDTSEQDVIQTKEAQEFADSLGLRYLEISTKNDDDGPSKVATQIMQLHCQSILNLNSGLGVYKKRNGMM
jgi:GTPase SAR1 family protein